MKVLFNSDVLYNFALPRPLGDVPKWLVEICQKAQQKDANVVFPETTILELNRIQAEAVNALKETLHQAADLLAKWKVLDNNINLTGAIPERDLIAELRAQGINAMVEKPTLDDFREAHRRACAHAAPQPQRGQKRRVDSSDEMRDLLVGSGLLILG